MARTTTTLKLSTEDDTARLGSTLARYAQPGDCFLLRGQIGSGKSALARAFVRSLLGPEAEVPSPTFTLVQTYDFGEIEIWHADLYRLADAQEAVELGLAEAMDRQICLIEWPELLDSIVPETAFDIELAVAKDYHLASLTFGENWQDRVAGNDHDAQ